MNILFAGAFGYGNIGDDSYRHLFPKFLEEHNCYFDSPFPDLHYFDLIDYLVIGGGGLIFDNKTMHFEYMQMYMDKAIEVGVPYSFISCGVQVVPPTRWPDIEGITEQIKRWKKYLLGAETITMRSEACKEIISNLTNRDDIKAFPDLCYAIEPCNYRLTPQIDYGVIIPTKSGVRVSKFKDELKKMQEEFKKDIFALSMSPQDNPILKSLDYPFRKNLSPDEAARIICDSRRVLTARFHGMVMAYAFDIPVVGVTRSHKFLVEKKPLNKLDSLGHITALKSVL